MTREQPQAENDDQKSDGPAKFNNDRLVDVQELHRRR